MAHLMERLHAVADLRARLRRESAIAFVPTMGNLHAGHLSLVRLARERAGGGCVVASLFVNRLQFGPQEDFDRYPRTLDADCDQLDAAGCDIAFAPDEATLYPTPQTVFVTPPPLAAELDGAFRPGHFQGVTTIVAKLFHLVSPDIAVFGKKDYQQWRVIEAMAQELNFPIEIVAGETARADDGLALSSRNAYLSPAERAEAPRLHRLLVRIRDAIREGETDFAGQEADALAELTRNGWRPDYLTVRDRATLAPPAPGAARVVLAAARLGATRLIDNIEV